MRYSDGPSVQVDLLVDASPERVWELVSDIELPTRFSAELQGVDWLDGVTSPALGARFVGRSRHPAIGDWETTSIVVDFDPPRTFGWVIGDAARPSAQWRFTLVPDTGGTRLTQWMRMGPGRSGINPAIEARPDKETKILERRLAEHEANMLANLVGIKSLAEA